MTDTSRWKYVRDLGNLYVVDMEADGQPTRTLVATV